MNVAKNIGVRQKSNTCDYT